MKLYEIANNSIPDSLILTVGEWTGNTNDNGPKAATIIFNAMKSFPQFQYTGSMYRKMFLFDKGEVDRNNITRYIVQHEGRGQMASWSEHLEGLQQWESLLGDELEDLDPEHIALHTVLATQTGMGFSVSLLWNTITDFQHKDWKLMQAKGNIERAANVAEVIAPYYPKIKAKIIHTQKFD